MPLDSDLYAVYSAAMSGPGGPARRDAVTLVTTDTYNDLRTGLDAHRPIAIIERMDYFDDWSPEPCKHDHGWVTAYISPYTTTIECPECGETREVHDH